MWMNTELTDDHKKYIYEKYPNIRELHCCIREFRHIFKKRNVPLLYLFIEKSNHINQYYANNSVNYRISELISTNIIKCVLP